MVRTLPRSCAAVFFSALPTTFLPSRALRTDNKFSGYVLPCSFDVDTLEIQNNYLSGTISDPITRRARSIQIGNVDWESRGYGNNQISGTFPSVLLSNEIPLTRIGLEDNLFSGTLPSTCGQTLQSLSLGGGAGRNIMSGYIPECLFQLETLRGLSLSENSFSGDLEFGYDSNTQFNISHGICQLNISYTKLSGTIPWWFNETMPFRQKILMNSNSLSGTLPTWAIYPDWNTSSPSNYCNNGDLQLEFAVNSISGTLPSMLGRSTDTDTYNIDWMYYKIAPHPDHQLISSYLSLLFAVTINSVERFLGVMPANKFW
jgi:hypothetical protein